MIKTIEYFEVTLVYEDGSTWFAGGFNTQAQVDAWIATEQSRPYWNPTTQVQKIDKSYTIEVPE